MIGAIRRNPRGAPPRLIEAEIHSDSTRELVQKEQFECQFHG